MALKVVGTGFGRTGTNSLKLALEQLDFGPCHHMFEIRDDPAQLPLWEQAASGHMPDWDAAFDGYASSVDWPSVFFWREITDHYGDAKVVHTHRPEDDWLRSIRATIYPVMRDRADIEPGHRRDIAEMCQVLIGERTFGGRLGDPEHAKSVYRAHDAAVRAAFPPERLLVLDVAEGWAPLCDFLGVGVPDVPFPFVNRSRDFKAVQEDASKWE